MVYSKDLFSDREGKPLAANFPGFRLVPEFLTGAAGCECAEFPAQSSFGRAARVMRKIRVPLKSGETGWYRGDDFVPCAAMRMGLFPRISRVRFGSAWAICLHNRTCTSESDEQRERGRRSHSSSRLLIRRQNEMSVKRTRKAKPFEFASADTYRCYRR